METMFFELTSIDKTKILINVKCIASIVPLKKGGSQLRLDHSAGETGIMIYNVLEAYDDIRSHLVIHTIDKDIVTEISAGGTTTFL
jgi:hypothetical protein